MDSLSLASSFGLAAFFEPVNDTSVNNHRMVNNDPMIITDPTFSSDPMVNNDSMISNDTLINNATEFALLVLKPEENLALGMYLAVVGK